MAKADTQAACTAVLRRTSRAVLLAAAILCALPSTGSAARLLSARTHVAGDSLLLDAELDSLFNQRALDAIASGMTTSIVYHVTLERDDTQVTGRSVLVRLDHDIWEGRYRIVRQASSPDTLDTASYAEAAKRVGSLDRLFLGTAPADSAEYAITVRVDVNPISPEQRERTRRWLNLLQRGSLLELFINLEPEDNQGPRMEILRFRADSLRAPREEDTP